MNTNIYSYEDLYSINTSMPTSGQQTHHHQHHLSSPISAVYPHHASQIHPSNGHDVSPNLPPSLTPSPTNLPVYLPSHSHLQEVSRAAAVSGPIRRRYSPDSSLPLEGRRTSSRATNSPYAMRRGRQVSDEEDDYLEELPSNATDQQRLDHQRQRNTLAARRSRRRKEVYRQQLEETVEWLTMEKEKWKTRAEMLRRMMENQGLGLSCPDWSE